MANLEELGEVISTDILVIGGGISGLCAAIKAKEKPVNVLVVDKGEVGWAGHVPISGGGIIVVRPERSEEFFEWAVQRGYYLNNQDWIYTFARDNYESLNELATYGFPFAKDDKGKIAIRSFQKDYEVTAIDAPKSMVKLKKTALDRGIKTLGKVFVVDLLKRNGKVVGAIGFGLVDGKTYIFNAKAIIIACSSCRYKRLKLFLTNAGEGPAMAYRAGAELMNAEFHNTYGQEIKDIGLFVRGFWGLWFENALGENIMEKHYPELMSGRKAGAGTEDFWQISDAMFREVKAGRGPIYLDASKLTSEEKDLCFGTLGGAGLTRELIINRPLEILKEKAGIDPDKGKFEVHPMFTAGQGPLRIDLDCRTTLDGLWGVGDAGSLGSGWTGARASGTFPGWSIPYAILSGLRGGRSASEYADTNPKVEIHYDEARAVKDRLFTPLGRSGDINVHDVFYQIHEAVVPMKYNFHRQAGRMREALAKLDTAKQNLNRVGAKDSHELYHYHQAESMALDAEWTLSAALMREESRGTHYREDFPDRDDKDWLKWIVIKEENGIPRLSTEDVPIQKYRVKP